MSLLQRAAKVYRLQKKLDNMTEDEKILALNNRDESRKNRHNQAGRTKKRRGTKRPHRKRNRGSKSKKCCRTKKCCNRRKGSRRGKRR